MNPNLNYSLFNSFYHDPRASLTSYSHPYEPSYHEEHDHQEYTFLPKTSFFDHFIGSDLDVTRQSTEATEGNESTPLSHRPISPHALPYQKYNLQDYNSAFNSMSVKPLEMVQNRYSEGAHFHSYNPNLEPQFFQNQHIQPPVHNVAPNLIKMEEKIAAAVAPKVEKAEVEENEEEQPQSPEVMLNAQLKSLLDAKLWSEEKDQTLLKLGAQYKCDWKKISKRFNNKKITPHFLKIRYKELTCAPLQRRVKFNHREDLMIAKYFEKYGSNWAQMAVHFKDRSAIMLKNRYYSFIRKRELIDNLLQEVKEFEKNDQEIDLLKDHESEKYIDLFSGQKGAAAFREDSDDAANNGEFGTESSVKSHQVNHAISVSEKSEKLPRGSTEEKKMVGLLKARVKSLQSLYLATKAELDKLKLKN